MGFIKKEGTYYKNYNKGQGILSVIYEEKPLNSKQGF